jgi:hypothetical protein
MAGHGDGEKEERLLVGLAIFLSVVEKAISIRK